MKNVLNAPADPVSPNHRQNWCLSSLNYKIDDVISHFTPLCQEKIPTLPLVAMPTRGIERIALVSAALSPMIVFYLLLDVGVGKWQMSDIAQLLQGRAAQWRELRDTLQAGPALLTIVRLLLLCCCCCESEVPERKILL
jgi:hypothetical protein